MKLLLTSAGIKNTSIHDALVDLLGKPIAESTPCASPPRRTGTQWPVLAGPGGSSAETPQPHGRARLEVHRRAGAHRAAQHRRGALGAMVRETDVLLVDGGDALYLCHWMRQSGLADLLPSLRETVWVGLSAGSMVMTPGSGRTSSSGSRPAVATRRSGIVDFSIYPHLAPEGMPGNTMAEAETMGGRHRGSGIRDRRRDGHQGRRRHGRGRLRGALEAVHPKFGGKRNG